ncbi:asparagine synthase-like protein [Ophiocordyceps camponoti-floridani]|uniref:Asparagine synthase-like protein n=1 Tax=Ophiocordyceps camponoti-floridani TaxID=2030778 RepID=A0A8H4VAT7_9HYPO|nr:asparagine synthase-like protein [Ophiocordyceps camponoti-floridani]
MCGIFASVSSPTDDSAILDLLQRLQSRGPDHVGHVRRHLRESGRLAWLTATVLALRGDGITRQPLVDDATGSVLCWNGEAWAIGCEDVRGNDAEAVMDRLAGGEDVVGLLRAVEGPFAFVYLDWPAARLYYGRDRLGRRSLLVKPGDHGWRLASIAPVPADDGWAEVDADGFYVLSLDAPRLASIRIPWTLDATLISGLGIFNSSCPVSHVELTKQSPSVAQLREKLEASLRRRVLWVPLPPRASPSDATVGVLFSGGLDCTVLARMVSDILSDDQAVDLINVAFENPRIAARHPGMSRAHLYELCPDRITARRSFDELLELCPQRRWRLVTVDVSASLASSHRSQVVELMFPHKTEMDLSIAFALYFAARGQGVCREGREMETREYTTTARVLLSGLGADELFGGYVRHATAFSRQGYPGLIEELKLDVSRLGQRNLGRDDRVMAHWAREVRFPYLDEALVRWAMETPVWNKCDFATGGLEPGKRVLRLLAQELGMVKVAMERKRAIQFGARTAKMESGKTKGTSLISP